MATKRRGIAKPAAASAPRRRRKTPEATAAAPIEEVAERAARLGITSERVLLEYGHIAFADLRHIIEWDEDGWRLKPPDPSNDADWSAISEIAPGADPQHPRVKLYDRKAALDAIARHLGMFPLPPRRRDDAGAVEQEEEDPREFLARELARIAARAAEK